MFRRFHPVNTKKIFPHGKWLFLLVTVLLFALVATTAAQEEASDEPVGPPVPEPIMNDRIFTPEGVEETRTFPASKDSYLSSAQANTNYGLTATVKAGYDASFYQAMRMLFEFNLSSIPSNSVVNSATMSIYQTQSVPSNDANMGLQAQYMKTQWSETGVTWNNANDQGGDVIGVGDNTSSLGWKTIDVTNVVREWVSGAKTNYGFFVIGHEGTDPARSRTFQSRQGANPPSMTVNFNQSCDNVAPTAWVETLPEWSQESFTVRWTGTDSAPSGCEPVGIAYYDVQYNINGGSWADWKTNTTSTSGTFKGANNGQTYQFMARAVDKAGNVQSWTGVQTTQTKIDTIHPEASVVPLGNVTFGPNFTVNWDGTDNSGGSGIANYDVQFFEGDGDWQPWLTGTTAKSATFVGGQNGVEYGFRARATDRAGNVQPYPDGPQTVTTVYNNPVAIVVPFNPIVLNPASPVTDTITVSWLGFSPPSVNISGYQVAWKFNNGSWTTFTTFGPNTNSFDFVYPPGNGDGTYYFEASALSSIGSDGLNGVPEALQVVDMEAPFLSPVIYSSAITKHGD